MRITFNSINRPKSIAKSFRDLLTFHQLPSKLSAAQELTSKMFGYRNWHELTSSDFSRASPDDAEIDSTEALARRTFQINALTKEQLSEHIALSIVTCLQPTRSKITHPADRSLLFNKIVDMVGSYEFEFTLFLTPPYKMIIFRPGRADLLPINGKRLAVAMTTTFDLIVKDGYDKVLTPFEEGVMEVQTDGASPLRLLRLRWDSPYKDLKGWIVKPFGLKFIAEAQDQLKRLGLYEGRVTGTVDYTTRRSLKAFQTLTNLEVNGGIGPDELKALNLGKWVRNQPAKSRSHLPWLNDTPQGTAFDPNSAA